MRVRGTIIQTAPKFLLCNKELHPDGLQSVLWPWVGGHGPFGIIVNKSKCFQMHCQGRAGGGWGKELNWANYVPRKALSVPS